MGRVLASRTAFAPPDDAISELYHENTKLMQCTFGGANARIPVEYTLNELAVITRSFKEYRMHPRVALPAVHDLPRAGRSFDEVVAARRTVRGFAADELEVAELGKVLHQTYGVTGGMP